MFSMEPPNKHDQTDGCDDRDIWAKEGEDKEKNVFRVWGILFSSFLFFPPLRMKVMV